MKAVKRKLYKGNDGLDAKYEIAGTGTPKECALRVFDVIGGDALVFLTPARVLRLIDDLKPYAGLGRPAKSRRR